MENPLAGGAEVHLLEIFRRLVDRGHHVTQLAASFSGSEPETEIEGIRVKRLVNRYGYYFLAPPVARRMVAHEGYDVVVDILAKLPFLSPWFQRVPCLAIIHHLFGTTAFQQVPLPVALVTYLSEKLIPGCYSRSATVVISPSTLSDMVVRGLPEQNMSIIPNGVDHQVYAPSKAPKSEQPLVAWLGRVEPYKRLDLFLDAFAQVVRRIPDAKAVVIGSGTGIDAAKAHTRGLGLENLVEFCGFVDTARKIELLRSAQMLINTSEKEGWGLTVVEGNACGTITIASDVPGLRDSVRHGETGVLVPHGDVDRLASEMLRLLEDEPELSRLSANAITWAGRFQWDAVAEAMEEILDSVAAGSEPSAIRKIDPVFGG